MMEAKEAQPVPQAVADVVCHACDGKKAELFCSECGEDHCKSCSEEIHKHAKKKTHKIIGVSQKSSVKPAAPVSCQKHSQPLLFYCETDKVPICLYARSLSSIKDTPSVACGSWVLVLVLVLDP
jgi:hypothetical protein